MEIDEDVLKTLRALQDEQAVRRTLHRYCHAIDYGDEAAWVDLFLEDGVFDVEFPGDQPAMHLAGRAALEEFIAAHPRAPGQLHKHVLLNPIIDVSGDEARVASYFQLLLDRGGVPETFCFGRYLDRMRRGPGGVWRFIRRLAEVQSTLGRLPRRS